MTKRLKSWTLLWADTEGVTALEYALMGSLIAIAIVAAVANLGTTLSNAFTNIGTSL